MLIPGIKSGGANASLLVGRYNKPAHKELKKTEFIRADDRGVVVAQVGRRSRTLRPRANVVALIKKLSNPDPFEVINAARTVGRSKSKAAVLPLIALLTDDMKGIRDAAWKALKDLLAVPAIKLYVQTQLHSVRRGLKSIDPKTRSAHAYALGYFGDRTSILELRKMLKSDSNFYARAAAAWSLAELKDTGAVVLLGTTMDETIRTSSARHFTPHKQFLLMTTAAALKKLNRAGMVKVLINRLKRDLRNRNWKRRARAAWGLAFVRARSARRALLRQLKKEKNYVVLKKIASALERNGSKRDIPILIKILKRGIPNAQQLSYGEEYEAGIYMFQVAKAIARLDGRSVIPVLKRLLNLRVGKSKWIQWSRLAIICALLGNKEMSAVPDGISFLSSKNWEIRLQAAIVLAICGNAQAIKPLIHMLARERYPRMKRIAAKAIFRIVQQGGISAAERVRARKILSLYRMNERYRRAIANNVRRLRKLAK